MTKRLFIAVKIHAGSELIDTFETIRKSLKNEKIKWVDPNILHITLKFLGDTQTEQIGAISQILKQIATQFKPFEFIIQKTGVFRSLRDPRVIWFGIDGAETMAKIAAAIEKELAPLGFPPENKDFKPHLTLGRIKEIENVNKLKAVLNEHHDVILQTEAVPCFYLYESVLTPKGPVYSVLEEFGLGVV